MEENLSIPSYLVWDKFIGPQLDPNQLQALQIGAILFGLPETQEGLAGEWRVWGLKKPNVLNEDGEIDRSAFEESRTSLTSWSSDIHKLAIDWLFRRIGVTAVDAGRFVRSCLRNKFVVGGDPHSLPADSIVSFHQFSYLGLETVVGAIVELPKSWLAIERERIR